jgi:hypothetical protein
VDFIATNGWRFLPAYTFFMDTGEWKHRTRTTKFVGRKWLGQISYAKGRMDFGAAPKQVAPDPATYLALAAEAAKSGAKQWADKVSVDQGDFLSKDTRSLRWFIMPSEAAALLRAESSGANTAPAPPVTTILNPTTATNNHHKPSFASHSSYSTLTSLSFLTSPPVHADDSVVGDSDSGTVSSHSSSLSSLASAHSAFVSSNPEEYSSTNTTNITNSTNTTNTNAINNSTEVSTTITPTTAAATATTTTTTTTTTVTNTTDVSSSSSSSSVVGEKRQHAGKTTDNTPETTGVKRAKVDKASSSNNGKHHLP